MRRRPTIGDVAEVSGFSPTTVSHALSGKRALNAETVRKIRAAANELGYVPSRSARSLRSGRTGTIGLLSPVVGDRPADNELLGLAFYMRLTAEVARRAFQHEQAVLLLPHTRDAARLSSTEIDGAILSDPEQGDPVLAALRDIDVPVVTIERDPDHPGDPWHVRADHARATREVLDHLRSQGSARPALVIPKSSWAWVTEVRDAYERWCAESGLEPIVELARENGSERAVTRLLSGANRPDGLYVLTEAYGPAALRAATRLGLDVPADVLLACGIDSPQALSAPVPLTAVAQAPERQARAAVDLLLERLGGGPGAPVVIEPELVVRRSSSPPGELRSPG